MNTTLKNFEADSMEINSEFINDNFLLENDTAQNLYHNYAKKLPIIDLATSTVCKHRAKRLT